MSADDDIPPQDDGSAPPPEGGAPATPPAEDPFAALKEADRAAEEAAAAAPAPAEDDPFAALKEADRAEEEAAAASEPDTPEPAPEAEAPADTGSDTAPDADAPSEAVAEEEPSGDAPAPTAFRYDEKLYEPVSDDAPAGSAIEFYHFADMDQDLAWPQNEFGRPDPGQRPNFRAVRDAALGFLKGTKEFKPTRDVRPMLGLAIAEAGDGGPVGLAKALDLFVATATTHWDAIHPQKEDEDDDELMTRMEEMRKYMNPQVISMAVQTVAIARSPRVGDLTTRTFGIAATKVTARDGEFAPNSEALTALLSEEEDVGAKVTEAHDAYKHAIDRLRAMEAFLEEHPDVDPVDLNAVASGLETLVAYLAPYVATAAGAGGDSVSAEDADVDMPLSGGPSTPIDGPKTLEEAMSLLDEILVFYALRGRSSPVPLGLIALRDLISSDFNTWLNQTASEGLAEAAVNLSLVDATRLASYASGDIPAAAPAPKAEIDFSVIDPKLYDLETAFATIDTAVYTLQQRLVYLEAQVAESEGAGEADSDAEAPLAAEVVALRAAIDGVQGARTAMESGTPASSEGQEASGSPNNAAEGDMHHSRITDRTGVKMALDAVAAYFEREEPSSPAPAYLKRLKGLVDARFTEIARELMPEGGGEAKLRLEPRTKLR